MYGVYLAQYSTHPRVRLAYGCFHLESDNLQLSMTMSDESNPDDACLSGGATMSMFGQWQKSKPLVNLE